MASTDARLLALEALVQSQQTTIEALTGKGGTIETLSGNAVDVDIAWLVICGAMVFFMQAGFSMLEAGAVGAKNVINILFKNVMDGSVAALCFWLLGYGFAYGPTVGGFIGNGNFGIEDIHNGAGEEEGASDGWEGWFFQWAFAGTAATIVSGSVAERTKLEAYLVYSAVVTSFIYPVVVHWGWGEGWLSAWGAMGGDDPKPLLKGDERSNGMIDFAGSGVVHMVGGFSGLVGAIIIGPRHNRFDVEGKPMAIKGHNTTMMALGTVILWFGWYGFNCGSTLGLSGGLGNIAGKVAVTTTIAAAAGCLTATAIARSLVGSYDISVSLNGVLAGLVGITANCSVVNPWHALLVGMVAAFVYFGASRLLLRLQVDDPLDAFAIHGACGAWGLLATGIFCTDENVQYAGYPNTNDACGRGEQFAVQLIGVVAIAAWSASMSGLTFLVIKATLGVRVSEQVEAEGLDRSEHGMQAYSSELLQHTEHGSQQEYRAAGSNKIQPHKDNSLAAPPPSSIQPVGVPPNTIEVGS
mmetsp:Transcript_52996/g.125132  ORF Transcript_52996/g.125132 Transcript_52996/m.125132 type:complete len:525 (-) Transcript_52996:313-1887(-)